MKQRIILLLLACAVLAGCSSSIIDNTPAVQISDEELDVLFDKYLPGPSLPPDEMPEGIFCTDFADSGLLRVCYKNDTDSKLKLQVISGSNEIIYNLSGDGSIEDFSLQFGSGEYTAKILQNTEGQNYFVAEWKTFDVNLKDETCPYLTSVQNVSWNYDMLPIKDVRHIVANSLVNKQGDEMLYNCGVDIYKYIVNNIKYDSEKIYDLTYDYLPDIEQTYIDKKGICYDYASLFASMLRSINIPVKLIKGYAGYSPDTYHAWNEVYWDGKWVTIDVTRDASLLASGVTFEIEKDSQDYTKIHEY